MKKVLQEIAFALLSALLMMGQGTTSRITGVVMDATGAMVPGATVTVTNEGTGTSYSAKSGDTGVYVFDSLQIGSYTVAVNASGFKKFVSTGNVLSIGNPITVNARLEIGATGESVEVKGGYDLVQTDSSGNFGNLLDQKSITELPIVGNRGRNPLNFIQLVPGVEDAGGAAGGEVSVHGSRDRAFNYTLDGVDINETSAGGSNFSPLRTNPDSISEFKVITGNFTAEYGRDSGAQVVMITRSGTNQFHGTGFWFYQSPFLNANTPQDKAAIPPIGRQQFVQNIYGGSLGGPVIKNNTFFFVNAQLLHALNTGIFTSNVYTASARQGLFRYVIGGRNQPFGASGASVDQNGNPLPGLNVGTYNMVANDPAKIGLDPAVTKYLATTPLPNTFAVGDGLNTAGFNYIAHQLEKQVDLSFKIDHNFNANNSVFVRWASGHQNTFADFVNGGQPAFPGFPNQVDTFRQPRNLAVNWRSTLSPTMVNELVLGMNRFGFNFENPDPNVRTNPPFNFNLVTSPLNSFIANARFLTTYQLVDNFTKVRGSHTFKAGINFRYGRHIDRRGSIGNLDALQQVFFDTGTDPVVPSTFNLPANINTKFDRPTLQSAINDLLGRVGVIQQGFVAQNDNAFFPGGTLLHGDERWPEYDFYGQDTWKLKPNLTVDLGLRLDARLSPRLQNFPNLRPNQPFAFGLTPSNTLAWVPGDLIPSQWKNFGPSIGFAWDPFKDGKTSVRANYRIAYDRLNTFSFSSSIYQGLPGLTFQLSDVTSGGSGLRVSQGIPNEAPPAGTTPASLRQLPIFSTNSVTVADPNMETPRAYMWGLSIQRQVAHNTVLSMTYNGRHGVALYGGYDANQADITNNGFLDAFKVVQAGGDSPLFDQLFAKDSRRASSQTGSQFARSFFSSNFALNNVAGLAQSISQRSQGGTQLLALDGMSPFFFVPFPQFAHLFVLDTHDYSVYHGLETQIERRFSDGLLFQGSWTWSKSEDTRSFDPTFTRVALGNSQSASATPYDLRNPHLNWAPSDFDRTHVLQTNWVYELPFGSGKRWGNHFSRAIDEVLGGWEIAGDAIYETGRPFTVYSGSNTLSSAVQTPANCSGDCNPHMGSLHFDPTLGQQFYFTPAQIAQFSTPGPGEFSNRGRNAFRLPIFANLNATIGKTFKLTERQNLEARLEMQNVTNSQMYDLFASSTITSGVFSRANQATDGVLINTARTMQLSLKYNF